MLDVLDVTDVAKLIEGPRHPRRPRLAGETDSGRRRRRRKVAESVAELAGFREVSGAVIWYATMETPCTALPQTRSGCSRTSLRISVIQVPADTM